MSRKILVVDDEPLILIAVEKALTRIGYRIVKAKDREELETALLEAPFDLLLTDVFIEGTTVDEVICKVKASSPDAKVIRMSGSVNREKSKDFIEKPFRIEELRERVREVLNEPSRN